MKKGCLWVAVIAVALIIVSMLFASSKQNEDVLEQTEDEQVLNVEKENKPFIDPVKVKELSKHFIEKKDEFSNTKWIEPKTRPKYTNQNGYCMYFSTENGVANNPRFLIQYESDDWLFIQHMI
jgi:hypothetical protein